MLLRVTRYIIQYWPNKYGYSVFETTEKSLFYDEIKRLENAGIEYEYQTETTLLY